MLAFSITMQGIFFTILVLISLIDSYASNSKSCADFNYYWLDVERRKCNLTTTWI